MRATVAKALGEGENCEMKVGAGHTVGAGSFAGVLCLTDLRLLFVPGLFSRKVAAVRWTQ